jgi:hypothetical protein
MFKAAWEASFTVKNITGAFAKTGIFPYNLSVVLGKITPLEPSLKLIAQEQTPISCLLVWRMHKAYQRSPIATRLTFILHANTRLAAQHSIDKHTIGGLIRALKDEKKKRSRGKRLNLLGEESSGPQFYSPATVHCAKIYASEKEAGEQQERDRIAAKKASAVPISCARHRRKLSVLCRSLNAIALLLRRSSSILLMFKLEKSSSRLLKHHAMIAS